VVQEHLETFFAQVEAETGASLPDFVKDEFDAFLECGILAHGFLRLRCARVARMRSWWPSPVNGAGFAPPAGRGAWRRALLTWSTTSSRGCRCANGCSRFRFNSRILFAAHPDLLSPVLECIHRVVPAFLIKQSGLQRSQAHTGAVTLIQRFGSAANLNIHLHCLVLDGVYRSSQGVPVFHEVRGPSAAELEALLGRIIQRILKLLTRTGYLVESRA